MSCPYHVLCRDCYAGMVDIGEAKPNPEIMTPEHGHVCCACRVEFGLYPLAALPKRFPFNGRDHPTHPGDITADNAARRNRQGNLPDPFSRAATNAQVNVGDHPTGESTPIEPF